MAELSPEKRLLLAFALSIAGLWGWTTYMRWKYPAPPEAPAEEAPAPAAPAAAKAKPAAPVAAPLPAAAGVKQGTEEQLITIDTADARIVLSSRGAVVKSWTLKHYHDAAGKPLELVQGEATGLGYPLALALADRAAEEKLNGALFRPSSALTFYTAPADIVFEWSDGHLAARKRFRFQAGTLCEIESSVSRDGWPLEHALAWRGGFGEHAGKPETRGAAGRVFVRTPSELKQQPAEQAGRETGWIWKRPSPFPYRGAAGYAGLDDQYFAAVFLPEQPELVVTASTRDWKAPGAKDAFPIGELAVSAPGGNHFRLFVGPKAIDALEAVPAPAFAGGAAPELASDLVSFGWFSWVAKPMFWAMQWLYRHVVRNYGWVIVLLTLLINALLYPLKLTSMESASKMQKVAPQAKAIQARYQHLKLNDPRREQMNKETMALYQQHGINPLGGCLPLLLQFPFFIGFYNVLAVAIELRQAPWILWIKDLSQKDPYYILPVLMTATMYISTKMTTTTATDPMQQRMMQVFMLVFGYTFLFFSSGLVLYWLVSSGVGIGQQWWINKRQREREQAAREQRRKRREEGSET